MTFRRLADYSQIITTLLLWTFLGGGLYYRVVAIEDELEARTTYIKHNATQDMQIRQLQIEAEHRDRFYELMEDMLKEMQGANKELSKEMLQIKEMVLETKYKVESIEKRVTPQ